MSLRYAWYIVSAEADSVALQVHLEDGWEPFAVTVTDETHTVWLRRQSPKP